MVRAEVLGLVSLMLGTLLTSAAAQAEPFSPAGPLADLLNADGTLNLARGFHGSVDARGWVLTSGPAEAPRFAPAAATGDERWAANFSERGVDADVRAMAVDGSGNIDVGGRFLTAGNVLANRVARWNGGGWSALGSGTNGVVVALAVRRGTVYAGGGLTEAGGKVSAFFGQYDARSFLYLPLVRQ